MNEISNSIREEFDCRPINNKKFLKTKIRSYGGEATDFCNKKMPTLGSSYIYLAVISINFVCKKDENYYQQMFLKKWKYIEKETKKWLDRHIIDELNFFSDEYDEYNK